MYQKTTGEVKIAAVLKRNQYTKAYLELLGAKKNINDFLCKIVVIK